MPQSLPQPIQDLVRTAITWHTIVRNPKIARATVIDAQKALEAAIAAIVAQRDLEARRPPP